MKRGDIYFADLNPTVGAEAQKRRPVLIVSNNANNKVAATVTIIPITSVIQKIYPFEVFLASTDTGLAKDSKAQCHQIRTISKLRISGSTRTGHIGTVLMTAVINALKIHLDME